jgi:hypothetical protein
VGVVVLYLTIKKSGLIVLILSDTLGVIQLLILLDALSTNIDFTQLSVQINTVGEEATTVIVSRIVPLTTSVKKFTQNLKA